MGDEIAGGRGDRCSADGAFRGVICDAGGGEVAVDAAGTGVAIADWVAAGGAIVADVEVVAVASDAGAVVLAAFTNFFEGASGGGVASDFIFSRAFFASS